MKAKMPNKPVETARYLCMHCGTEFDFRRGYLECPSCGNTNKTELVAIDVRNYQPEENLYTEDDWHGG